jgi:hypothetical protein
VTLRIKSAADLKRLQDEKVVGLRAASRISAELQKLAQSKSENERPTGQRGKSMRSLIEAGDLGLESCAVPPVMPADILYQAMVRRWGRFYSGGEVVWELQPFTGSRYRLDASLPRFHIGVEMDGWQFHGRTLDGFKKDREKQLEFCRRGWLLFRASNEQVRNDLENVLDAIAEGIEYQARREIQLKTFTKGWSRIVVDTCS